MGSASGGLGLNHFAHHEQVRAQIERLSPRKCQPRRAGYVRHASAIERDARVGEFIGSALVWNPKRRSVPWERLAPEPNPNMPESTMTAVVAFSCYAMPAQTDVT
ncbi:MAG: hypothetical protein ACLT98_13600 [Eggerthellaceae bacterium]